MIKTHNYIIQSNNNSYLRNLNYKEQNKVVNTNAPFNLSK